LVGLPVEILTATTATPELVGAADWDAVVIATGGRPAPAAWAPADDPRIVPLRAVLSGTIRPAGRVVLVDEVAFHQASGTAELLAARGCHVTLVTPDFQAAGGLGLTLDLPGWRIRAARAGITVRTAALPTGMTADGIRLLHYLSGATVEEPADWVVLATPELPDDHLYRTAPAPGPTVLRAGDCVAPRRADAAVREGREAGRRV
jgi:2,4-dienoyl-CoA reductase (NADPH2)